MDEGTDFERSLKLLAAADSPGAFDRGRALVEQAAAAGDSEAAAMLGTMEAIGAARPRNWLAAFDWLARAAEAGSVHACASSGTKETSRPETGPNRKSYLVKKADRGLIESRIIQDYLIFIVRSR